MVTLTSRNFRAIIYYNFSRGLSKEACFKEIMKCVIRVVFPSESLNGGTSHSRRRTNEAKEATYMQLEKLLHILK